MFLLWRILRRGVAHILVGHILVGLLKIYEVYIYTCDHERGLLRLIQSTTYISPRSWLTSSHWVLAYFMLVGQWWHSGRSRSEALFSERGLSRSFETLIYMRTVD